MVITVAISQTFGNLDLVVKALDLSGRNGIGGMSNQAIYPFFFQFSESDKGRDPAFLGSREPFLPANFSFIGSSPNFV